MNTNFPVATVAAVRISVRYYDVVCFRVPFRASQLLFLSSSLSFSLLLSLSYSFFSLWLFFFSIFLLSRTFLFSLFLFPSNERTRRARLQRMVKILSVKLLFRDLGKTEILYCFVTYSFIRSRNPVAKSVAAILLLLRST